VGRIAVLDEATAGRIAAGEVIERPASVVKELVENAVDAGAGRVEIDIEDGGRSLVRVADDGEGMDSSDALLCFQRHATSKLSAADDLEAIGTFGFRGEALPSIAAVARVRLLTCPHGAAEGTDISYEGGRLTGSGPGAARPGTVVWVRDLYFNTPARRRAMRSSAAETAKVSETAGTLALAAPDVALSLSSDGRLLWSTPGDGSLEAVAASLFGGDYVRNSVRVAWRRGPVGVTGLAGLPALARRDGKGQYLLCNGRPINPRLVRAAVDEAYKTLLGPGRTPVFILDLRMPPEAVDVNIHPAKTLVRFRSHGQVMAAVATALRAALTGTDLFPGRLGRGADPVPGRPEPGRVSEGPGDGSWGQPGLWAGLAREDAGAVDSSPGGESLAACVVRSGRLEALGQAGNLFIVARGEDGVYIIDQHAAHERVVFERLLGPDPGRGSPSQVLAVPETVHVSPGQEGGLSRSLLSLRSLGLDVEEFGPRTVVVRAVPAALTGVPAGALVREFLDRASAQEVRGHPDGEPGDGSFDMTRAARVMAACKAALKAGTVLSSGEMQALLDDLCRTSEPRTCPHGRPTILRFGLDELRRGFGRA